MAEASMTAQRDRTKVQEVPRVKMCGHDSPLWMRRV